jgi:hypothetical protein
MVPALIASFSADSTNSYTGWLLVLILMLLHEKAPDGMAYGELLPDIGTVWPST